MGGPAQAVRGRRFRRRLISPGSHGPAPLLGCGTIAVAGSVGTVSPVHHTRDWRRFWLGFGFVGAGIAAAPTGHHATCHRFPLTSGSVAASTDHRHPGQPTTPPRRRPHRRRNACPPLTLPPMPADFRLHRCRNRRILNQPPSAEPPIPADFRLYRCWNRRSPNQPPHATTGTAANPLSGSIVTEIAAATPRCRSDLRALRQPRPSPAELSPSRPLSPNPFRAADQTRLLDWTSAFATLSVAQRPEPIRPVQTTASRGRYLPGTHTWLGHSRFPKAGLTGPAQRAGLNATPCTRPTASAHRGSDGSAGNPSRGPRRAQARGCCAR